MILKSMWKHFLTITKHKTIVCCECIRCGQTWRGLMHDNSKYGITEFISSAKYFQGDKSPIETEKAEIGYSAAWMHHKGHNPHHWEYWIDYGDNGEIIANKIPYKYIVEMVCDWVGAGMVYNKGTWTRDDPIKYYMKVRSGRYFHSDTESLIVKFLVCIQQHGLAEFHQMAKCKGQYANVFSDYVRGYGEQTK